MVFTDGRVRSIESIMEVFNYFAKVSGLQISMEKTTIFYAGMSEESRQLLLNQFHFTSGTLPVRYLGLPLLTRQMRKEDYQVLIEKITKRISLWTNRFLSMAGRLQLIKSVLMSIVNFWMTGFKLPGQCIKEINSICSAFLWSGPSLNTKKAKISWDVVCLPMQEGGLGLRSLKEMNKVLTLKLVWRILSNQPSLWTNWIRTYLINGDTFWSVKNTTTAGSWMWRKLLKYRDLAKQFLKMKVGNGLRTSFWFESWSPLGCLYDITGDRGCIDLGIRLDATVSSALSRRRRRNHRVDILNMIEAAMEDQRAKLTTEIDCATWKYSQDVFKPMFSTKHTWSLLHQQVQTVDWSKDLWFMYHNPKFAFFTWLAIQNRLTTGDRMLLWSSGANPSCVFCNQLETRDHLFFSCPVSADVWSRLMKDLLEGNFTTIWTELLLLIKGNNLDFLTTFLTRYIFQLTIHSIWRERNDRRHGATPTPVSVMIKMLDRHVRNRCLSFRQLGDFKYAAALSVWLSTR